MHVSGKILLKEYRKNDTGRKKNLYMDDLISMCNLHHRKKAKGKRRKACHG